MQAREKLETIIIRFCKSYGFSRPRMYRKQARKNYLALAKAKKRSTKKIRATIRKQLAYIKRDIGYLESYMEDGYAPTSKEISVFVTNLFKIQPRILFALIYLLELIGLQRKRLNFG